MKITGIYGGTVKSLFLPIGVQLVTVVVSIGYVLWKRYSEGDTRYGLRWFSPFSSLASARGRVPLKVEGIFSFLDQLNGVLTVMPQRFLPKAMQTVLSNSVVIWTALIAYFYNGSRFKQVHYAGCVLVVLACLTGTVVELQDRKLPAPTDSSGDAVTVATGTMALMYAVFFIGVIPSGMSSCYKQKVTKSMDLDLMWITLWSANFQVLWALVSYNINWAPYPIPGGYNTESPATLAEDLGDAWTCLTGTNPTPEIHSCSSDQAWLWFLVYLLFSVSYKLCILWLTKYLSATWASIGNVLCYDMYGVFGQFGVISGVGHNRWMPLEQWLALAFTSVAMWVYNTEDEVGSDGESVYGVVAQGKEREPENSALKDGNVSIQV
jgi:hypothetical protein